MNSFKNFLLLTVAVFGLAALVQPFTPWWTIAIAAAIAGLFSKNKPYLNFFAGFIGIGLLWASYAWWLDTTNDSMLSYQVGQLFNGLSPQSLVLVTATIGGLVGGMSAMSAGIMRGVFADI